MRSLQLIETQLNFQGEVETDVDWDEDLTDKSSEKYKDAEAQLEKDLKEIVEADDSIEAAELTECDFEPVAEGRKRREGKEFENLVPVSATDSVVINCNRSVRKYV